MFFLQKLRTGWIGVKLLCKPKGQLGFFCCDLTLCKVDIPIFVLSLYRIEVPDGQ